MKRFTLAFAVLVPGVLCAQELPPPPPPGTATAPPGLQRPYEAVRDFFNYYAMANAFVDSNGYYVTGYGNSGITGGMSLGGGVSGFHQYATGLLSLSYRGSYYDYFQKGAYNGNNQTLVFAATKNLKHWTFNLEESGGIFFNQGTFYGSTAPNQENTGAQVQTNPFSNESKFLSSTISGTYAQSMRLSYSFSAQYMFTRFTGGAGVGTNDITGTFSTNYRLSRRNTLSGSYSHSNYRYQRGIGNDNVDTIFATFSRALSTRDGVDFSGGISRSSGTGAVVIPIGVTINGVTGVINVIQNYQSTSVLPYWQASYHRRYLHQNVSVNAGESVTPGNGIYLTTKSVNVNGLYVREFRNANISAGAFYWHSSIAQTGESQSTTNTRGLNASYSYNLMRHVGVNASYSWLQYGTYGSFSGRADNRLSFGIYFESKDIPLGLY